MCDLSSFILVWVKISQMYVCVCVEMKGTEHGKAIKVFLLIDCQISVRCLFF